MPGNSIGQALRITTAGESHGPGNVVIIDGVPPGIPLVTDDFALDMARRRPGQSKITTQRKEADEVEILSGVFADKTTGTALALFIKNADHRAQDYDDIKDKYRPGHADYTFDAKYGFRDYRGGGRSSARETNVRVAAGVIAKKILARYGVGILGYVIQIGSIHAKNLNPEKISLKQVESNPVRCPDPVAASKMIRLIEKVRKEQDSIGGIAEIRAMGMVPGWGEPVFDKLKADLAKAFFSLPAVLGVEYGSGFAAARLRGSENNDIFVKKEGRIFTKTNRHGGLLGGISSGMPIVMRCVVKPTSSLSQPQPTITRDGKPTTIQTKGRHDPCLLPRFIPMAEAMMALTLADHALRYKIQMNNSGASP